MKSRKGCWTCKDRRVLCDGGLPTCEKCTRTRRVCQGYGTRLSWPRDGDKKRSVIGSPLPIALSRSQITKLLFINTTWRDMELYHRLNPREQPIHVVPTPPKLYKEPHHISKDMDLVGYFHNSAHHSLVTFDMRTFQIRDVLIRMALANDTVLGRAILYALLAFSSLHRDGLNQRAMKFKISALHCLSTAAKEGPFIPTEAAQHVAASMLLGAFDILLPSASSGEWLWYTQGAMNITHVVCLETLYEGDFSHLLDWVYFHDALSRFPTHHWQHASLTREFPNAKPLKSRGTHYPPLTKHRPALPPPNPSYVILNLLSEACDTLLDPRDPASHNEEYRDRLKTLERRIGNVHTIPASSKSGSEAKLAIEVFQLATHVYLARASQSPWETPASLEPLIEKAFAGPLVNCACAHFFPLFIIACEARNDDRRVAILNLIDNSESNLRVRSRVWLKEVIQSVWVHQDLHADEDLLVNYVDIMSDMISSSNTIPSFI